MKKTDGFTLAELMVAILVLAIGLLGLAGLQATSLSGNHNAYLRTQATLLAQDMADRMRDNRGALDMYAGNGCVAPQQPPPVPVCTDAQMAQAANDLAQWHQAIVAQLPSGTGNVSQGGNGLYTILITWTELEKGSENGSGRVERRFDMGFQP